MENLNLSFPRPLKQTGPSASMIEALSQEALRTTCGESSQTWELIWDGEKLLVLAHASVDRENQHAMVALGAFLEALRLLASRHGLSMHAKPSSEVQLWAEVRFLTSTSAADSLASYISVRNTEPQRRSMDKKTLELVQNLLFRHPDLYVLIQPQKEGWLQHLKRWLVEKKSASVEFDIESSSNSMDLEAVPKTLCQLGALSYQIWLVLKSQGFMVKPMTLSSLLVHDYYSALMGMESPEARQDGASYTRVKMKIQFEIIK